MLSVYIRAALSPLCASVRRSAAWLTGLPSGRAWQVRVRTTHPAAAGNRSDASSVDSDVLLLRTGAAHTRWLELLRVSEGGATAPDFLADHNSGDFKGDTAFLSTCGTNCGFYNFSSSPRVRYCVEMAVREFPNPNTTGGAVGFADYLSCPGGHPARYSGLCNCDVWTDRIMAHQSKAELDRFCPAHRGDATSEGTAAARIGEESWRRCTCANFSMASGLPTPTLPSLSQNFVGMMPINLPCTSILAFRNISGWAPGSYPTTRRFGAWFSTPSRGQCPPGAEVGDGGCSWRRDPTALVVYGPDLLSHGWNLTAPPITARDPRGHEWWWVPERQTEGNLRAVEGAFRELGPRCCGC